MGISQTGFSLNGEFWNTIGRAASRRAALAHRAELAGPLSLGPVGADSYSSLTMKSRRFGAAKAALAFMLATLAAGCEKATSPADSGPSRFEFTFSGTVHRILEDDSSHAKAIGVHVGDSVAYTFLVDIMQRGFNEYPEGRYPEEDSSDVSGRRPRYFFDSLLTPPLNLRVAQYAPYKKYYGYRTEQENGYAGTFFTHQFNHGDSVLNTAICFNDAVGGPLLPAVGDIVTGTEHFYIVKTQKRSTIQSSLVVIAIVPVP